MHHNPQILVLIIEKLPLENLHTGGVLISCGGVEWVLVILVLMSNILAGNPFATEDGSLAFNSNGPFIEKVVIHAYAETDYGCPNLLSLPVDLLH